MTEIDPLLRQQISRIASYGVIVDNGQILLCRLSEQIMEFEGYWTLPGGGIDFGEHPETGMIREVKEETGLSATSLGLLGVDSITRERDNHEFHSIRIIYNAQVEAGELVHEMDGTTDMCAWHDLTVVRELPLVDLVHTALDMGGH